MRNADPQTRPTGTATGEVEAIKIFDVPGPGAVQPLTPRRHGRARHRRDAPASGRDQSLRNSIELQRRWRGRWQEGCWAARQSRGRPFQRSGVQSWEGSWHIKATSGMTGMMRRRRGVTSVGVGAESEEVESGIDHKGGIFCVYRYGIQYCVCGGLAFWGRGREQQRYPHSVSYF
jgi:hypothetical protein